MVLRRKLTKFNTARNQLGLQKLKLSLTNKQPHQVEVKELIKSYLLPSLANLRHH